MKPGIISTIIMTTFFASCNINVKVKKDAKNSALKTTSSSETMNAVDSKDFLKHLDGLRTTAADIIIKELARRDYVSTFRGSVRKYRKFIIEKSATPVVITDNFYTDDKASCRPSGLSLNIDNNNEMLGMILKTVVLAKLSEADVGKLNVGLAKELQAVTQVITMELGVDIQGSSSVVDEHGMKTTKGNVKIKLKPIANENVDEQVKKDDENEILSLDFERSVGSDMIGSFVATMNLSYDNKGQTSEANGNITVSRVKSGAQHIHDVLMTFGTKGSQPSYTREIIVKDNPSDSMKFEFQDILNSGSSHEIKYSSIVDIKAGTQCKGSLAESAGKEDRKTIQSEPKGSEPMEEKKNDQDPIPSPTPSPTPNELNKPTQAPVQSPIKAPVQSKISSPAQMKS